MFNRESESFGGLVFAVWVMLLLVIGAVTMPPQTGYAGSMDPTIQFVASDVPDQYGQYIVGIEVETNVSGSWVNIDSPWSFDYQGLQIDWNASQFIQLKVQTMLNSTYAGVATTAEGKSKIRHNVTVTNRAGTAVFSQANLTYVSASDVYSPMFYYEYSVILNFVPQYWDAYTVLVSYEVVPASDWYNLDWQYRKSVTISGNAGAGTDYSVLIEVPYNAAMQATFADVIFTDNDGTTALGYWRETYTASTTATFWVKVNDNLDSGGSIYMYYGNAGASYTGAGEDVFIFFDDFEGSVITPGVFGADWDETGADWSVQSSVKKYGSYAAYCDSGSGGGGVERNLFYNQNFSTPIMVHSWFRVTSTFSSYRYGIHALGDNNIAGVIGYANDWIWWNGGSQTWELNTLAANTWYRCELAFDYTNDLMRFWKNRVSVGSHDMKDYNDNDFTWHNQTGCLSNGGANANYDQYQDDFYIRKYVFGDCSFSAFGTAEENTATWTEAEDAFVVFSTNQTSMSGWLVLAGMGLVACSGAFIYTWHKSRKDMFQGIFIFLIMIVLGFGLWVGGIMP